MNVNNKKSGFIQIILMVVFVLVLAGLYGYNPEIVWDNFIGPILYWLWDLIESIANFILYIIRELKSLF